MIQRIVLKCLRLSALVGILAIYSGYRLDSNHQFILGTWANDDTHLIVIVKEKHLEISWTFASNRYYKEACCFTEAAEKGT
jgi:hypothetical protein